MTTKQTAETKVTAENITDEQIRELIRASCEHDVIVNLALGYPDLGPEDRRIARERCAELWNLRAIDADGARGPSALISADERNLRDHANALLPSREWHALDAALTELHELRTDRTRLADRCRELEGWLDTARRDAYKSAEEAARLRDQVWDWRSWSDEVAPPFGADRDRSDKGQREAIQSAHSTALQRIKALEGMLGEALEHMHHERWCRWNDWEAARSECNCGQENRIAELRKELSK